MSARRLFFVTVRSSFPGIRASGGTEVLLREFRAGDVIQLAEPTHLIDVDAEVGAGADQAVGVGGGEAVVADQPLHQVDRGGLDGHLQGAVGVERAVGAGRLDDLEGHLGAVRAVVVELQPALLGEGAQGRVERGVANASAYPLRSRDTVLHSLIIGRDPRCDVVVTDSRASRRHARVDVTGETVAFEDLDSTNGTLYNGEPTRRGHLLLGDRLQIGDTIFRIAAET